MVPDFAAIADDGNSYVPNMSHSAHIDINNETTIKLTAPVVDATELLAATTVAASTNYAVDVTIAESFGRSISVTSTDAGDLTLVGFDFLGQVMTETITCTAGTVAGAKAFKRVTELRAAADLAGDVTLKAGAEFGLPFCAVEVVREVVDGAASTDGVITPADTTTPSETTGDVRGTFNPNTASDGVKDFMVTYIATAELSGGLYGQVQA